MAYATITDLEARLNRAQLEQLTATTAPSSAYDAALNAALDAASAEIDAYAGGRFELPLATSVRITELTVDIAAYKLERKNNVVRESERLAYEDAIRFLKLVAEGKATLDQPAGEDPQLSEADVLVTDQTRVFSKTNLKGF